MRFGSAELSRGGCRYFCLSDFVAPKETGIPDYLGLFVNTAGLGLEKLTERYKAEQVCPLTCSWLTACDAWPVLSHFQADTAFPASTADTCRHWRFPSACLWLSGVPSDSLSWH